MMSSNWWANKLSNNPNPIQSSVPPVTTQPAYIPPEVRDHKLPASATSASRCPNCSSQNYGGTGDTRPRCYDCGYPIQQTGSGTAGISVPLEGPTQPAKQVSTENNFNPQGIIGHI
jgi:hypothetical protein